MSVSLFFNNFPLPDDITSQPIETYLPSEYQDGSVKVGGFHFGVIQEKSVKDFKNHEKNFSSIFLDFSNNSDYLTISYFGAFEENGIRVLFRAKDYIQQSVSGGWYYHWVIKDFEVNKETKEILLVYSSRFVFWFSAVSVVFGIVLFSLAWLVLFFCCREKIFRFFL